MSPTKSLILYIMRSRVHNFPIMDGARKIFVYPLQNDKQSGLEAFPDEHGKVRNVRLSVPPPGLDGSPDYVPPMVIKIERRVKNVIVIVPNNDEEEDHETGIAGSEEMSEPVAQAAPDSGARHLSAANLRQIFHHELKT